MTATFAHRPWPATAGAPAPAAWRFGREVVLEAAETAETAAGPMRALRWVLARNCSITPRQLGRFYLSLCFVAAAISAGFWWQGAPFISAFAGIEILAIGAALLAYARHAADREVLTLAGRLLAVEQRVGGRVEHADLECAWLTVEPAGGQGSLIELKARGRTLCVGRFLRPEVRGAFAQELRRAVRRAGRPAENTTGSETE